MHSQAESNRRELSKIYSYVRDLILEREQTLKRQISENLVREEEDCESKLAEITDYFSLISSLKSELVQQNSESEIDILLKAKLRVTSGLEVNG